MKYRGFWMVAVVGLMACGAGGGSDELKFEKVVAEKSVSIANEAGAPTCNVKVELDCAKENGNGQAKALNEAVVEWLFDMEGLTIQQAADSLANSYTRDYQRNFAPLYREDKGDAAKRAWYEYHYYLTSEVTTGRKGVIVYTATLDYYEGGAHGINQRLVRNFDVETDKMLTLADIFVPGFERTLNEKLLQALLEKTDSKNVDELRGKGYLYSMDMFAPENFILGKDDITFVYNPYELASYSEGMIELTIEYDDLEGLKN